MGFRRESVCTSPKYHRNPSCFNFRISNSSHQAHHSRVSQQHLLRTGCWGICIHTIWWFAIYFPSQQVEYSKSSSDITKRSVAGSHEDSGRTRFGLLLQANFFLHNHNYHPSQGIRPPMITNRICLQSNADTMMRARHYIIIEGLKSSMWSNPSIYLVSPDMLDMIRHIHPGSPESYIRRNS